MKWFYTTSGILFFGLLGLSVMVGVLILAVIVRGLTFGHYCISDLWMKN